MPVRIRLALHGCTNRPFYHVVVAPSKAPRNGRHLEQVGSYDPMPNYNGELLVGLNLDRIKYWMGVGAQPTVAVYKLLSLVRTSHAHYHYTVLCMAAVVNRGCRYSNSGARTIAHACTNNAERCKGDSTLYALPCVCPPKAYYYTTSRIAACPQS
jgi:ribosomal protein S16